MAKRDAWSITMGIQRALERTVYSHELNGRDAPKIILKGEVHLAQSRIDDYLIPELKPNIPASESLVDSTYFGRTREFFHRKFWPNATELQRDDIQFAPIIEYANALEIDAWGIDHPTLKDDSEREEYMFNCLMRHIGDRSLVYATVGDWHVRDDSALVKALKHANITFVRIFNPGAIAHIQNEIASEKAREQK